MANQIRTEYDTDEVFVGARIPVEAKRELADLAKRRKSNFNAEVNKAISRYLKEVRRAR